MCVTAMQMEMKTKTFNDKLVNKKAYTLHVQLKTRQQNIECQIEKVVRTQFGLREMASADRRRALRYKMEATCCFVWAME